MPHAQDIDDASRVPCPACDATGVQGHTTRYWCALCDGDKRVLARIAQAYERSYRIATSPPRTD